MTAQAGQDRGQKKPGRVDMQVRWLDVMYQNLDFSFTMSQKTAYGRIFKITKKNSKQTNTTPSFVQHSLYWWTAHLQAGPQTSSSHMGDDSRIASFTQHGWCHSVQRPSFFSRRPTSPSGALWRRPNKLCVPFISHHSSHSKAEPRKERVTTGHINLLLTERSLISTGKTHQGASGGFSTWATVPVLPQDHQPVQPIYDISPLVSFPLEEGGKEWISVERVWRFLSSIK